MRPHVVAVVGLTLLGSCQRPTSPNLAGEWYQAQPGFANARPCLLDSLVVAGAASGTVIARDRRTGSVVWSTQVPVYLRIRGAQLVTSDKVVVVPVDFDTFGLDGRTGAVLWHFQAPIDSVDGWSSLPGSVVAVHPDADSTTSYIPAWGGSITAVDSRSGAVRWQWLPDDTIPHRFGARGVAIDGDRLLATVWHFLNATGSQCEGWVVGLDRSSGRELWRTIVASRSQGVCLPGKPALANGYVIVSTMDGFVYALRSATGEVVWRRQPEVPPGGVFDAVLTSPLAVDDVVLVDAGTAHLLALRVADGTLVRETAYGGELKHDAFATRSRVYAPDGRFLYVFDRVSGRLLATLTQPNSTSGGLFASAVIADSERVYAPVNGAIWAFPAR